MEENKQNTLSLSTLLFIMVILVIVVMAFFIYKINIEKNELTSKVSGLENQINTLQQEENNSETIEKNNEEDTNILEDIVKMEVSVLDESSIEGIKYTTPIEIKDKAVLKNILEIINSAKLYPDEEFDREYGAGDYFEGCPELTLYDSKGNKYHILACDNFDETKPESMNIFYISKDDKYEEKIIYKTSYTLQSEINKIFNENKR